jgi:hypothetical protein
VRIYGRALGLPQRPNSSSLQPVPSFIGLSYAVVARIYGDTLGFFQEQAPDDILTQHHQWDPCLSVEIFRHFSKEPARLTTKQDTPHLSRHQVSQVSTQELQFERVMILPYQGVSRFEFQLYCRRIPFVIQGVVRSHSAGLQVSWTFVVIVFKEEQTPDGFHTL